MFVVGGEANKKLQKYVDWCNDMTILNDYDNWHLVPTDYAKVAEYKAMTGSSATDTTLGTKIETTYDAYVSVTQTADSYEGKVKYVLVHPNNAPAPQIL